MAPGSGGGSAPGLPPDPDCEGSGACIVGNFGQAAFMYFPGLHFAAEVASYSAGPPTTNTFVQMVLYAP